MVVKRVWGFVHEGSREETETKLTGCQWRFREQLGRPLYALASGRTRVRPHIPRKGWALEKKRSAPFLRVIGANEMHVGNQPARPCFNRLTEVALPRRVELGLIGWINHRSTLGSRSAAGVVITRTIPFLSVNHRAQCKVLRPRSGSRSMFSLVAWLNERPGMEPIGAQRGSRLLQGYPML